MRVNFENKIFEALSTAFDYILLAFCWIVFCLPVVTAGASTTAVFSACMDVDMQTSSVALRFFRAFKSNFLLATQVWLTLVALGAILALDIYVCWVGAFSEYTSQYLQLATIMAGLVYLAMLSLAFGLIAKFKMTYKQVFYNIFVISVQQLKWLLLLMLLNLAIAGALACLSALGFIIVAALFYLEVKVFAAAFRPYTQ